MVFNVCTAFLQYFRQFQLKKKNTFTDSWGFQPVLKERKNEVISENALLKNVFTAFLQYLDQKNFYKFLANMDLCHISWV